MLHEWVETDLVFAKSRNAAVIVGAATWLVLAGRGVQHAAIWGILAGVFNSIPYFGPVIIDRSGYRAPASFCAMDRLPLQLSGAGMVIMSLEGWLLT